MSLYCVYAIVRMPIILNLWQTFHRHDLLETRTRRHNSIQEGIMNSNHNRQTLISPKLEFTWNIHGFVGFNTILLMHLIPAFGIY